MKRTAILFSVMVVLLAGYVGAQIVVDHRPGGDFIYRDTSRAPSSIFWVNSTDSDATDSTRYGYQPDAPLATVDYAIGQCSANANDVIFVMPGHVEDGNTGTQIFDADIAGISIIGLGNGADRPRFDYNGKTTYASVGANSVLLKNLTFRPSAATVAKGIDVESSTTNVTIEECEFMVGEEGDGTDEFVKTINVNTGADDLTLKNNVFRTHPSADGCTEAVHLGAGGSVDRALIQDNVFEGNYSTAAIADGSTACTELVIKDNSYRVKSGSPDTDLESGATGIFQGTDPVFVTCTLSHDTVTSTAFDVTAASSGGALMLEEAIVQNGGTAFDSSADGAVFEMFSDNTSGSATWFKTTEASLAADVSLDIDNAATTGTRMVLESGKKIKLKATTEDFTSSTGNATIYLKFRPVTAGASVVAGSGCQ